MSTRVLTSEVGDRVIELYEREGQNPEVFCEGIQGFAFAGTHVKFNMFSSAPWKDPDSPIERREVAVRIVMPVTVFVEAVDFLQARVNELKNSGIVTITRDAPESGVGSDQH
jgi:hypothetical protein